jgi:hypothetical protein
MQGRPPKPMKQVSPCIGLDSVTAEPGRGGGCGRRSPPPARRSRGIITGKFSKLRMLVGEF